MAPVAKTLDYRAAYGAKDEAVLAAAQDVASYQSGQRLMIEANARAEPFSQRARHQFMDQFFK